MLDVLAQSLTVLEQLAPIEPKLRSRRKSLADEIGRAAESIALNTRPRCGRSLAIGSLRPNDTAAALSTRRIMNL